MEFAEFERLCKEVRAWSRVQFPNNTMVEPVLGIGEELGELLCAVLKARQGIRFTPEECVAREKDAVGDMVVFLADAWARRHDDHCPWSLHQEMLADLFIKVSRIMANMPVMSQPAVFGLLADLDDYCVLRQWDLSEIVRETWGQVRQRNWRSDPKSGGGQQDAGAGSQAG